MLRNACKLNVIAIVIHRRNRLDFTNRWGTFILNHAWVAVCKYNFIDLFIFTDMYMYIAIFRQQRAIARTHCWKIYWLPPSLIPPCKKVITTSWTSSLQEVNYLTLIPCLFLLPLFPLSLSLFPSPHPLSLTLFILLPTLCLSLPLFSPHTIQFHRTIYLGKLFWNTKWNKLYLIELFLKVSICHDWFLFKPLYLHLYHFNGT